MKITSTTVSQFDINLMFAHKKNFLTYIKNKLSTFNIDFNDLVFSKDILMFGNTLVARNLSDYVISIHLTKKMMEIENDYVRHCYCSITRSSHHILTDIGKYKVKHGYAKYLKRKSKYFYKNNILY